MNDNIETEPKKWKWGIVYFNPDDSRVVVPKSTGLGWTLNLSRPTSWLFLGALVVLIVVLKIVF